MSGGGVGVWQGELWAMGDADANAGEDAGAGQNVDVDISPTTCQPGQYIHHVHVQIHIHIHIHIHTHVSQPKQSTTEDAIAANQDLTFQLGFLLWKYTWHRGFPDPIRWRWSWHMYVQYILLMDLDGDVWACSSRDNEVGSWADGLMGAGVFTLTPQALPGLDLVLFHSQSSLITSSLITHRILPCLFTAKVSGLWTFPSLIKYLFPFDPLLTNSRYSATPYL